MDDARKKALALRCWVASWVSPMERKRAEQAAAQAEAEKTMTFVHAAVFIAGLFPPRRA